MSTEHDIVAIPEDQGAEDDERKEMAEARLAQLEGALKEIIDLADSHDQRSAEETLIQVADLAEKALTL